MIKQSTIDKLDALNIVTLYLSTPLYKISEDLHISKGTLKLYLNLKGIDTKKGHSSVDTNLIVKDYNNGVSIEELCKLYNVKEKTIRLHLNLGGILYVDKRGMWEINENFFTSIDSEEKAYWLGFIFADGYVAKDRPTFAMNLLYADKEHMLKFCNALNYKNPIREQVFDNSKLCRMKFDNDTIYKDLISYGCVPLKSLILKFPPLDIFKGNKEELIRHFIRGYFDGDGCITYSDKEHKQAEFSMLGTKEFLEEVVKFLPTLNKKIYEHVNVYSIVYTNAQAYNCIKYLYEGASIYLDRKFNRYNEFRRYYEKS